MKKALLSLMVFLLILGNVPLYKAEGQVPAIFDQAAVLDPALVVQADELAQLLRQHTGYSYLVLTKHFLGGQDVHLYARQMLEQTVGEQMDNTLLLVMVIGEDSYAAALGENLQHKLGQDLVYSLLSSHFDRAYVQDRAYDQALASFLLSLSERFQGSDKHRLPANTLLQSFAQTRAISREEPASTKQPELSLDSILESVFPDYSRREEDAQFYQEDALEAGRDDEGRGLSLFQIAIIGFLLYKFFGKKKPGRQGCGPLAWIFGTWGVSKFFRWRR